MRLINKHEGTIFRSMKEYYCEITDYLDDMAGITVEDKKYSWRHYVLVDGYCIQQKCLAIRIPGGTVGGIWFDENNIISKITVDTNYVVKTYPKDINEQLQKFVDTKIEF